MYAQVCFLINLSKCKMTLCHLLVKNQPYVCVLQYEFMLNVGIGIYIFCSLSSCIFSNACAFAIMQLVMSSDKLASLNEPLLNVDLDLQDGAGESQQVAIELDQEDLKKLLTSLESCSKVIQLVPSGT